MLSVKLTSLLLFRRVCWFSVTQNDDIYVISSLWVGSDAAKLRNIYPVTDEWSEGRETIH